MGRHIHTSHVRRVIQSHWPDSKRSHNANGIAATLLLSMKTQQTHYYYHYYDYPHELAAQCFAAFQYNSYQKPLESKSPEQSNAHTAHTLAPLNHCARAGSERVTASDIERVSYGFLMYHLAHRPEAKQCAAPTHPNKTSIQHTTRQHTTYRGGTPMMFNATNRNHWQHHRRTDQQCLSRLADVHCSMQAESSHTHTHTQQQTSSHTLICKFRWIRQAVRHSHFDIAHDCCCCFAVSANKIPAICLFWGEVDYRSLSLVHVSRLHQSVNVSFAQSLFACNERQFAMCVCGFPIQPYHFDKFIWCDIHLILLLSGGRACSSNNSIELTLVFVNALDCGDSHSLGGHENTRMQTNMRYHSVSQVDLVLFVVECQWKKDIEENVIEGGSTCQLYIYID